jgi:hypothetical protein
MVLLDMMEIKEKTMYSYDENLFSDLYKDAHGYRPRGHYFYDATPDEKEVIWNDTLNDLKVTIEDCKAAEVAATETFEKNIADIGVMAGNRKTAIRWFVESLELSDGDKMYGGEYVCYSLGLPYKMKSIFDEVINAS